MTSTLSNFNNKDQFDSIIQKIYQLLSPINPRLENIRYQSFKDSCYESLNNNIDYISNNLKDIYESYHSDLLKIMVHKNLQINIVIDNICIECQLESEEENEEENEDEENEDSPEDESEFSEEEADAYIQGIKLFNSIILVSRLATEKDDLRFTQYIPKDKKSVIDRLSSILQHNVNYEEDCCICLEDTINNSILLPCCKNSMHFDCLLKIIDHNLDFEEQSDEQIREESENILNNEINEEISSNTEHNILNGELENINMLEIIEKKTLNCPLCRSSLLI